MPSRSSGSRSPSRSKSAKNEAGTGRKRKASRSRSRSGSPGENTTLHIKNLTRNITEKHIEEIFGVYGKIERVDMGIDPKVKLPLGYGDITYEKRADAEKARQHLDGGQIDGNRVAVNFKVPETKKKTRVSTKKKRIISSSSCSSSTSTWCPWSCFSNSGASSCSCSK